MAWVPHPPRNTKTFIPRCLGSSEDSLLQQLSSRISIVSGASSASAASNRRPIVKNNGHKHQLYNRAGDMTTASQRELNLLLTTPTLPELNEDHKKACDATPLAISVDPTSDSDGGSQAKTRTPGMFLTTQVFASVAVSIGSMVVGFSSGYTSPALVSMAEPNSTLTVTADEASWIGSLMPLSALLGGIAGGILIELVGRKSTILGTTIPFFISWLLIGLAVNVPMIYVGRAIAGFCVGIVSLCLPVYMGETIQAEVRGTLGLISTTLGNIGILICFLAGKYLNWYHLAWFGSIIPVPFLICMCFVPETPRWYISKDKHKEAQKSLQWLRGKDADISTELAEIEENHRIAEKNHPNSMFELFTRGNVKPIAICIGLMFFQQLSGINAVIFYTVNIFKDAGSTIDGNLSTIIVGIVNLGSTFIATILIDRLGRKVLLYISAISMTISLAILGTFFYLRSIQINVDDYGWLPLVSFVVFVIGFSLGYGPIPWLMMGEILPAKIRGHAASFVTAFNWACTFIVTKTFKDLIEGLGQHGAFWMFGAVCLVSLFFVIFFVPETQGRSLEDIEQKFKGSVRRMSSKSNSKPQPISV